MSDAAVRDLARNAGVAVGWEDHAGKRHRVSVAVLRRILGALGLPCETAGDLRHSQEAVRSSAGATAAPLITATVGEPVAMAGAHDEGRNPAAPIMQRKMAAAADRNARISPPRVRQTHC